MSRESGEGCKSCPAQTLLDTIGGGGEGPAETASH